MMHYKIVVTGNNILVENYGSTEPIIGFVACRVIKAESEALAIATAKRNILVNWNQSFNADRKVGLPKLRVEKIDSVSPWLAKEPSTDYFFYSTDEGHREHLDKLTKPRRRWFKRNQ